MSNTKETEKILVSKMAGSAKSILISAKTLFWKHGIKRVTVEDICQHAAVSKMTFYRHFQNKHEVANRVIIEVFEHGLQEYRNIMQLQAPFSEKVEKLLVLKRRETLNLSEEFLRDIYQTDQPDLKNRLEKYGKVMRNELMDDFKRAQENGWIRKDIKLEFILYMLDQMDKIIQDKSLLSIYNNVQESSMELTKFFFYGILSNDKGDNE
ncbi:MAG: TetR/AcrR family transcriptional regulator [Cyclobacteriaceae bacterium]